jgi:c-di-GMP-related signal transduction protein
VSDEIHLARQPILDRGGRLYGFQLAIAQADGGEVDEHATPEILRYVLGDLGLEQVLGSLRGFLAVDSEFLHSELVELLKAERMVLELDAATIFDDALLRRCEDLQKRGIDFALSDYDGEPAHIEAALPILKFVKVDTRNMSEEEMARVCASLQYHATPIAEGVQTQERMQSCRAAGFAYTQGYYFIEEEPLHARRVPQSRSSMLRLLALIYGDAELAEIEDEFKRQPQLGYNLLRLVNSAASGLSTKIASIKHALVLLGRRQLERWLQLLLYAGDGPDAARSPLLQTAAMRGCLMEAIARHEDPQGEQYHDQAFMTGMLSLVHVLLGMSRAEMIEQLHLADEMRDGLIKGEGRLGRLLDLIERLETSDRQDVEPLLAAVKLRVDELLVLEMGAFKWANALLETQP